MEDKSSLYDLTLLMDLVDNNIDDLNEFIDVFLEYTPKYIDEMVLHSMNKDYIKLEKIAHKTKASLRLFNIKSIDDEIVEIETSSKNMKNLEKIPALVKHVESVLDQVLETMKKSRLSTP